MTQTPSGSSPAHSTYQATYYDILGLTPSARHEDIKQAYRRLAMEYHPDRNRDNLRLADIRLKTINEAYAHLKTEGLRARYDQMLKRRGHKAGATIASPAAHNDNSAGKNLLAQFWTWLFTPPASTK